MGLKDQVMALKWIQAAIKDFGGDPNLVTIFGESAGAGSTHFHLFSPLSTGLFHRAISQSGTGLCPWTDVQNKDTKIQAKKLGEKLKCPTGSSSDLVKCLRSLDGRAVVETQNAVFETIFGPEEVYGPTLENVKDSKTAFLTREIRQLYKEGKVSKVPFISGVTSAEGCWLSGPIVDDVEKMNKLSKNWSKMAPKWLAYQDKPQVSEKIMKYYFSVSSKQFTEKDYEKLTEVFSDRYFLNCHGETIRLHSKIAPTWSYYFDYANWNSYGFTRVSSRGKLPITIEFFIARLKRFLYSAVFNWEVRNYGACHADELQYQFYRSARADVSKSSPDYKFSKDLIKLWVYFAKNGYPGKYRGVDWEDVSPNKHPRYLHFGEPGGMMDEPFSSSMKFWDSLELTPK